MPNDPLHPEQLTLVPSYGRDYKTAEAVLKDWVGGKDFTIADISSPWNGKQCSTRDFDDRTTLKIRYHRKENIVFVRSEKIVGKVDPDNL